MYTSLEQVKTLPENLQQAIVTKVGNLETFFKDGKSIVLYGIESSNTGKFTYLAKITVKNTI
jgi:hypothetical protein